MTAPRAAIKALRNGAVARIIAANTAAKGRVWANRLTRLNDADTADGPVAAVYTPTDDMRRRGQAPIFDETVTLEIEALVARHEEADDSADALDDLLDQIFAALFGTDLEDLAGNEGVKSIRTETGPAQSKDGRILYSMATTTIEADRKALFTLLAADYVTLDSVHTTADVAPADGTDELAVTKEYA